MKELICKECGSNRNKGRRLCTQCNSKRIEAYQKAKNPEGRYVWIKNCKACSKEYRSIRKISDLCKDCFSLKTKFSSETIATNKYLRHGKSSQHEHRFLAEERLGRKLQSNEVVHHINCNPLDNRLENLMVLDRRTHTKLHLFLDLQRVIWEKSQNENHENCWNSLIVPITTTWLETTSVKVIKIWEIGQSAAELLKQKCQEEGSETTPVTS
jgi:hypothetical protein